MNVLYSLVEVDQWQSASDNINNNPLSVDQMFYRSLKYRGWTPVMYACLRLAPLELVQQMITTAKLDPHKRCLLAVTDRTG